MRPEYESKSAEQALAHLIEEAGEMTAAAGKTMRFGPDCVNPELPPEQQESNLSWLRREIADVERAIAKFRELAGP